MYIILINLLCIYLAFFSSSKATKKAFKVFSFFLLFEYITFTFFSWSFTEFYSIVAIECFILSILILFINGFARSFLFISYNFILSCTYLLNIYKVNILSDKSLWASIYNNQWIIGVLSVLFLLDHRIIYERSKHFITFCRYQLASVGGFMGMVGLSKQGNKK